MLSEKHWDVVINVVAEGFLNKRNKILAVFIMNFIMCNLLFIHNIRRRHKLTSDIIQVAMLRDFQLFYFGKGVEPGVHWSIIKLLYLRF